MSEFGQTVDDIIKQGIVKKNSLIEDKFPIGIKTPIEIGSSSRDKFFKMHYDIADQLQDNLKNLLLTQKGERLGFSDFGTNLRLIYSNSNLSEKEIVDLATKEIKNAVEKYMPAISLSNFYSERVDSENEKASNNSNIHGLKYSSVQSENINITSSKITEINKNDNSKNSVYKISVDFEVPSINIKRSLTLFVNSSK